MPDIDPGLYAAMVRRQVYQRRQTVTKVKAGFFLNAWPGYENTYYNPKEREEITRRALTAIGEAANRRFSAEYKARKGAIDGQIAAKEKEMARYMQKYVTDTSASKTRSTLLLAKLTRDLTDMQMDHNILENGTNQDVTQELLRAQRTEFSGGTRGSTGRRKTAAEIRGQVELDRQGVMEAKARMEGGGKDQTKKLKAYMKDARQRKRSGLVPQPPGVALASVAGDIQTILDAETMAGEIYDVDEEEWGKRYETRRASVLAKEGAEEGTGTGGTPPTLVSTPLAGTSPIGSVIHLVEAEIDASGEAAGNDILSVGTPGANILQIAKSAGVNLLDIRDSLTGDYQDWFDKAVTDNALATEQNRQAINTKNIERSEAIRVGASDETLRRLNDEHQALMLERTDFESRQEASAEDAGDEPEQHDYYNILEELEGADEMEVLQKNLEAIERFPEFAPAMQSKVDIMNSEQFKAFQDKWGYEDTEQAYRKLKGAAHKERRGKLKRGRAKEAFHRARGLDFGDDVTDEDRQRADTYADQRGALGVTNVSRDAAKAALRDRREGDSTPQEPALNPIP
jgi:hypothetical protein